jgi:hypothetical protein
MSDPILNSVPNDIILESGYTGQSISWTATDLNPNTYTIELNGSGFIVGPIVWASGAAIEYSIPDSLVSGIYIYTVNFTDAYGNSIVDSFIFTVEDTTNPIITNAPSDLTVEFEYIGLNISWTATDLNPNTYTIELNGLGIIVGPTVWASGLEITYNIPDGLVSGIYFYTVNFTDDYGNSIVDSFIFTVEDTTSPTITNAPSDLTVQSNYSGQSISWTAADLNPYTYTIELNGSGIIVEPTAWASDLEITYNIPDGLVAGVYICTVTFTDDYGNSIDDSVTITIEDSSNGDGEGRIPGASFEIIFILSIGTVATIIIVKKKKLRSNLE